MSHTRVRHGAGNVEKIERLAERGLLPALAGALHAAYHELKLGGYR